MQSDEDELFRQDGGQVRIGELFLPVSVNTQPSRTPITPTPAPRRGPLVFVVVVDEDTGRSAASTHHRPGFKVLVADISLGNVGLTPTLDVSGFVRASADRKELIELCALTGTLIADSDGIYAPGEFNGRASGRPSPAGARNAPRCGSAHCSTSSTPPRGTRSNTVGPDPGSPRTPPHPESQISTGRSGVRSCRRRQAVREVEPDDRRSVCGTASC